MKIILLYGNSGVGKTTLMKQLCDNYPNRYHAVLSYTDRPMREENEYGHIFLSKEKMQDTIKSSAVVAKTEIVGFFYCATADQFVNDKINIYIVDKDGFEMTQKYFKGSEFMPLFVSRDLSKDKSDPFRLFRKIDLPTFTEHSVDISSEPYWFINDKIVEYFSKDSRNIPLRWND